jgi:hypothetical protein
MGFLLEEDMELFKGCLNISCVQVQTKNAQDQYDDVKESQRNQKGSLRALYV